VSSHCHYVKVKQIYLDIQLLTNLSILVHIISEIKLTLHTRKYSVMLMVYLLMQTKVSYIL